jgi:hypothetical protein
LSRRKPVKRLLLFVAVRNGCDAGVAVALSTRMKSAIVADEAKRRETMRLINAADLAFKSDAELRYMIREYENWMLTMDASTYEYSVMRHSLEQIKRALVHRQISGPRF